MITPTVIPQPVQLRASVNAADLAILLSAVATSNVLPADFGNGKTLADVSHLRIEVLPAAMPDGSVAIINATIK